MDSKIYENMIVTGLKLANGWILKSVEIWLSHIFNVCIENTFSIYALKTTFQYMFWKHLFKTSFQNIFSKHHFKTSFQNIFSKHLTSFQNIFPKHLFKHLYICNRIYRPFGLVNFAQWQWISWTHRNWTKY